MKKLACICMITLLSLSSLTGCSNTDKDKGSTDNAATVPSGKVVINFEGTVTAVNENEITLDNGKVIIISSDTVFAGDPDTNHAVSKEISVGSFIQGYTADDPDAAQVSADKIYYVADK